MVTVITLLVLALIQTPQAAAAPPTVLRVAVGPSGQLRSGNYVLDEERSRFDPAVDRQVIVLFQWEGVAGTHRMSVTWKSPDGAASTTPPVEYTANDRRFGGYWPLTLSAATAPGTWTVQATVDGQPAGQVTFEVGASGGGAAPKPTRRVMTQSQLFARLNETFVTLERSTAKGRRLEPTSAVALGHGRIATAVAAIDGSDAVIAVLPSGKRQPMTSILAIDRAHDWVVLAGGPEGELEVPAAADNVVQVGDRCFSMEASSGGGRVLVDGGITGRAGSPSSGNRLVASFGAGTGIPGSPVFSEFGELVGVVGGTLVAGASEPSDLVYFRADLRGVPIVPVSSIAVPAGAAPIAFADAWTRGDVLHALEGREHILTAGFAKGILKDQVRPADQRQEFSPKDKEFVVFVEWGAQARLKGLQTLRLYDDHNVSLGETKPAKLDVRPGSTSLTSWKLPVPPHAGVYRAEVLIDGTPIWRGFVKVTD